MTTMSKLKLNKNLLNRVEKRFEIMLKKNKKRDRDLYKILFLILLLSFNELSTESSTVNTNRSLKGHISYFNRVPYKNVMKDVKRVLNGTKIDDTDMGRIISDKLITESVDKYKKSFKSATKKDIETVKYNKMYMIRRAASTETFRALNETKLELAKVYKFTKKTYITEGDEKVRKDHRLLDGKTIAIDEFFDFGNSTGLAPHDPQLPAEQVVGCRCRLEYK